MRALLVLLAAACAACAQERFVQAVEFPYHQIPRQNWERELVWLKAIGIRTVAFAPAGDPVEFLRLLRRVGLEAWLRQPRPELTETLRPHIARHGGPIAFAEGAPILGLPSPPQPVTPIPATDPAALARSRRALAAAKGSILWQGVEDRLTPALDKGTVALNGEERPAAQVLRREAALLRQWSVLLPRMRRRAAGNVTHLDCEPAGAVSLVGPFAGPLKVARNTLLPRLDVPAGGALWLPVGVSLGNSGLCHDCSALGAAEHIVYATAELHALEYENGILAMEFYAPAAGEAVLQLARQPSGPYLAAGRPTRFDWDEKTLRARLPIPAGLAPRYRVRVGLAIAAPEISAFFVDLARLIAGHKNVVSTSYSSDAVRARSRLRLPEGFAATAVIKSETEVDYIVDVPRDALHGDWVTLELETDGVPLARSRVQIFRPVSPRLAGAARLHFGQVELPMEPPLVALEAGRNVDLVIRNNFPAIKTFAVEAQGAGLEFLSAETQVSIGAMMERTVSLRVFGEGAGLRQWKVRIGESEWPMRLVLLPRGQAVAWSADLDGDGAADWVLENARARAVFSGQDGRWLEYVAKDSGANVLPEAGAFPGAPGVEIRSAGDALTFTGKSLRRTIRLAGAEARLNVEQDPALPPETLRSDRRLQVTREAPGRAVYTISRQ